MDEVAVLLAVRRNVQLLDIGSIVNHAVLHVARWDIDGHVIFVVFVVDCEIFLELDEAFDE